MTDQYTFRNPVTAYGKISPRVAQDDIAALTDEQFDQTVKTNVYAMFWLTKAAVPYLPAGATITRNFTKGLAQQLAPKGIRANALAPGPIRTPLQVSSGQPKEKLPAFGQSTPLGRAGQPAELAPAYVFLAVNGGTPSP